MAIISNSELKQAFKNGRIPTETDFANLIDTATTAQQGIQPLSPIDMMPAPKGSQRIMAVAPGSYGLLKKSDGSYFTPVITVTAEELLGYLVYLDYNSQTDSWSKSLVNNNGPKGDKGDRGLPGDMVTSATAPANPYTGMVWFNTGNNTRYTWDGTKWAAIGFLLKDIQPGENLIYRSNRFVNGDDVIRFSSNYIINLDAFTNIKAGDSVYASVYIEYTNAKANAGAGLYFAYRDKSGAEKNISPRHLSIPAGASFKGRIGMLVTLDTDITDFMYYQMQGNKDNFDTIKIGQPFLAKSNVPLPYSPASKELNIVTGGINYYNPSAINFSIDSGKVSNLIKTETGFKFDFTNGFWMRLYYLPTASSDYTLSLDMKSTVACTPLINNERSPTVTTLVAGSWASAKRVDAYPKEDLTFYDFYCNEAVTGSMEVRNVVYQKGNTPGDFIPFNDGTTKIKELAANPTVYDIPAGKSAVVKNTSTGVVALWANNAGTLIKTILN